MVSHHALQSTYMIAYGNGTGTCFTIDVEGNQYLITAEHVVPIDSGPVTVGILREEGFVDVLCDYVGSDKAVADVIVLMPKVRLASPTSLLPLCNRTFLSQDVYFLGFPYGLSDNSFEINNGYPIPLVKKACISMLHLGNADSKYLILDGHNNPGFSGGPVVWNTPGQNGTPNVAAVVSGYRSELLAVTDGVDPTGTFVNANTGLVYAYSIDHALDIIRCYRRLQGDKG